MVNIKELIQSTDKIRNIKNTGNMMLIWVTIASIAIGFCTVASYLLVKQIVFRFEVISKKNETVAVLNENNKIANHLINNVRKYEFNDNLASSKANKDEKSLQVVLDALPAKANSLALGASLQKSLIYGSKGVSIDSISVESVNVDDKGSSRPEMSQLDFKVTVVASDVNNLKNLITRLERSIRTIDVDNLKLERFSDKYTMTIIGHAYYLPAKTIDMTEERLKP